MVHISHLVLKKKPLQNKGFFWCAGGESLTALAHASNQRFGLELIASSPPSSTHTHIRSCTASQKTLFDSLTTSSPEQNPIHSYWVLLVYVRAERIELSSSGWKPDILPLNYARKSIVYLSLRYS